MVNGSSSNCNPHGVNFKPPSPDSPGGPPGSTAYTSLLELEPGKYLLEYDRLANGWHMPPGPYGDKDRTFSMVFSWTGGGAVPVKTDDDQPLLEERLRKLHQLHLDGALGEAEFALAKRQVLQPELAPAAAVAPPARGQPYLVTHFGAVGDGVADDTVAIQAAVDAALAPGGPALVVFPAGRFLITVSCSSRILLWHLSTSANCWRIHCLR